jgi:hypothetical protein
LCSIGALAVLKVGFPTPAKQQAALADQQRPALAEEVAETTVGQAASQDVLAKADKLDLDDAADRKTVQSIAIVPPGAAPKEKINKIVSRHWRDGYAKMKTRKHHRHHGSRNHHGPRKKHRR